jgi:hypothetical protein
MAALAYDQATHDIWYTDGNRGFYGGSAHQASGVRRFAARVVYPGN